MPKVPKEEYARLGNPLLPCPRCGSENVSGWDHISDCFHEVQCNDCRLATHGASEWDTSRDWNKPSLRAPFPDELPEKDWHLLDSESLQYAQDQKQKREAK